MTELERLNEKLHERKCNVKVALEKCYNYDTDKMTFVAYLEYYNSKRNYWGVLHNLGRFKTENEALEAAKKKLHIDNYL